MTGIELVRDVLGDDVSAVEADIVLLSCTPFPMTVDPDRLRPYLERVQQERIAWSTSLEDAHTVRAMAIWTVVGQIEDEITRALEDPR